MFAGPVTILTVYHLIFVCNVLCSFLPYFSSAVYIEGDIETRIYNDSIGDQVRNIPEICIRRDGMLINI